MPTPLTCWSREEAPPFEVQAHHLLCAVCVKGGCDNPPCGRSRLAEFLEVIGSFPHVMLRIRADLEVARAHYADAYAGREPARLPKDFDMRRAAFSERRKDLEVCRLLGIYPNTDLPAYHVYAILFSRLPSLEGMCRGVSGDPAVWPECPYARSGYYEAIAQVPTPGLRDQTLAGEYLARGGVWAMVRPRTAADMAAAKRESAVFIQEKADRLYLRPQHLLCLLCQRLAAEPLIEDNLVELRERMEADPAIPVTLVEGPCMVCDPCNEWHPKINICYRAHPKNVLRDLRMLEVLGLKPGDTLPARELYRRIFERIPEQSAVCGWGDGSSTAPFWAPCGGWRGDALRAAREAGFLQNCAIASDTTGPEVRAGL